MQDIIQRSLASTMKFLSLDVDAVYMKYGAERVGKQEIFTGWWVMGDGDG